MTLDQAITAVPSKEMAEILERLAREDAKMPDPTTVPPAQGREIAELTNLRWNRNQPAMKSVDEVVFEGADGNGLVAKLFTPLSAEPGLIFFIHGGGFAFCSVDTHEQAVRLLAENARCSVLSVSYRLAPENPHPAGLHDCIAAFRNLEHVRQKFPTTKGPLAISGDSAGANLALTLMLNEQAENRVMPDFAMLFYGVYGADFETKSYRDFADGPGLTRAKMMRYFDWYAPQSARNDPLVTPLKASDEALGALPPLYLNAAEIDPLCSDTINLSKRLRALGRKDQVRIFDGVVHGFMMMTPSLPVANQAIAEVASVFRQTFNTQKTNS